MQLGFKTHSDRNLAVKLVHSIALTVWLANSAVADSELTEEVLLFTSHGSAQERPSKLQSPGSKLTSCDVFPSPLDSPSHNCQVAGSTETKEIILLNFESVSQLSGACWRAEGGLSHRRLVSCYHILCSLLTPIPSTGWSWSLVPFVLASFHDVRKAL